jgi:hypothetical protein
MATFIGKNIKKTSTFIDKDGNVKEQPKDFKAMQEARAKKLGLKK